MKLYAISDLHVGYARNREALLDLPQFPEDWLAIAGDVGETEMQLDFALGVLRQKFARVFWVPGNHELWSVGRGHFSVRGQAKYERLVAICRSNNVLTPEDPYIAWPGEGEQCILAPLFVLYDYTFRPSKISREEAVDWAMRSGVFCTDEILLRPDPHPSVREWCEERCRATEPRLTSAAEKSSLILINHFPLRSDLVWLPRIPRFSIWCGTTRTTDWHVRFNARVVVSGHLHSRSTTWRDGVRFEEVSLGYPHQWHHSGIAAYLREILPVPAHCLRSNSVA
jgi:predicted phosphodiesterase